mgnify:FL=1
MQTIIFSVMLALMMLCGTTTEAAKNPLPASPEWIGKLPAAENAQQLFVVAGVGKSTAWVSMHVRDEIGSWRQLMTTPGFIGRAGLGKTEEGDGKTPVGTFYFTKAFGINKDPGCAIPYTRVDGNYYWSGDGRDGMMYNHLVDIRQYPALDTENSEHIIDYNPHYLYCLNISYNEGGTPGKGSAIFLHCFGPAKPYTGGCVAIPEDKMLVVMKNVQSNCIVVIDTLENLGGTL